MFALVVALDDHLGVGEVDARLNEVAMVVVVVVVVVVGY